MDTNTFGGERLNAAWAGLCRCDAVASILRQLLLGFFKKFDALCCARPLGKHGVCVDWTTARTTMKGSSHELGRILVPTSGATRRMNRCT